MHSLPRWVFFPTDLAPRIILKHSASIAITLSLFEGRFWAGAAESTCGKPLGTPWQRFPSTSLSPSEQCWQTRNTQSSGGKKPVLNKTLVAFPKEVCTSAQKLRKDLTPNF